MHHNKPIFYSALLLTGVNLLLRFAGTAFQVFLSARIGAEGIGLLQLVMSVSGMGMIAGMAGIRTATMYLTAEELGRKKRDTLPWVLSGCIRYSILCSSIVAAIAIYLAPIIAADWIGNRQLTDTVRLFAFFLPVNCLTGVMVGYFTGAQRITTLAAIEVAEQLFSIFCTILLLQFWARADTLRCCQAVLLGSGAGSIFTLSCLTILRLSDNEKSGTPIPIYRRLCHIALPLGLADDLKTGINTVENLMVPKRLALYTAITSPLAAFGIVNGMVFPILMFPACILFGLTELLIPELARCAASGSHRRIDHLVNKGLKIALLYGSVFAGLEFLLADRLCLRFYSSIEAGKQLRLYALLIPMLYTDSIVDAMTKGLGQQRYCVRYNIFTATLDVIILYLLLPKFGMTGYFISFALTHLINFCLSLHRLFRITGKHLSVAMPLLTLTATGSAVWLCQNFPGMLSACLYLFVITALFILFGIVSKKDFIWLKGLITNKSDLSKQTDH